MTSIVAIVGRPNVGKSTLFNRLKRSRDSLVDDIPGVTRDRLYASILWEGIPFTIIDTGGFDDMDQASIGLQVRQQVEEAIQETDRIIFMVDGMQGLMPGDEEIARLIRQTKKPVFLSVNKIDGSEHDHLVTDFYSLGIQKIYPVSAAHGYGLKSLMADVVEGLSTSLSDNNGKGKIRVAIVGRPNAGKSSLINRILGFERLIVDEIPGTTRDSVDIHFQWNGMDYLLIDTAGIRRRSKVKEKIEKFSVMKALRSLDRCHVAVILFDAVAGIAEQDARICGYAFEKGRGIIIGMNKWDLVKKDTERRRSLENAIDRKLQFISFAPRVNLSAKTGERVKVLFKKVNQVYEQFNHRVNTSAVNSAIEQLVQKNPPPLIGRGRLKFFYATQTRTKPPTFVVFVNRPDKVHFSFKRFMINQFRKRFGLNHTPIRLSFRKRE